MDYHFSWFVFRYKRSDEDYEYDDSILNLPNDIKDNQLYSFHYCRISEVIENTLNGIRSSDPKVPRSASTRLVTIPDELRLTFRKNEGRPVKVRVEEKMCFQNDGREIRGTLTGIVTHSGSYYGGHYTA